LAQFLAFTSSVIGTQ